MATRSAVRRGARFVPAAALYGLIFYLSSLERWPVEVGWEGFDKMAHALMFGLLGAALAYGFGRPTRRETAAAFLAAGVLAALDEIHQRFVPGRDASLWDFLADLAGAGAGVGIFRRLGRKGAGRAPSAQDKARERSGRAFS
jgi:VanZ family protein